MRAELVPVRARPAEDEFVMKCHSFKHLERIRAAGAHSPCYLDADTFVNQASVEAAFMACGGVMAGVDAVAKSECDNVFCAVRPPGHHAEPDRAMGFCLLNNIAVGARYAQQVHGLKKIFILDWDVHHGNGTQEIFYEDDTVFYFSIHQFPLYPGTGRREEAGRNRGKGFTRNVPLRAGSGDDEYLQVFRTEFQDSINTFQPDMIMISAGFDAHRDDPLAQMNVSIEGFAELTRLVKEAAGKYCNGRIVSVLEGGYDLKALADSVCAHIQVLMHD
jgi:acetoin utilization deacetylase AcuC-like enzyme